MLLTAFSSVALAQTTAEPNAESAECQRNLPLDEFLLPNDASAAKATFIAFRKALLGGDKKQVSDLIRFPLDTVISGYGVRFKDPDELLNRYDEVFNEFVLTVVKAQDPNKLSANWEGVSTTENALRFAWDGSRFRIVGISTRLEKLTGSFAGFLNKRKACTPVVIEGRIVAYDWASRMPAFENIYVDHYIVDVTHVLKGVLAQTRIRVDFWGVSHMAEYNLPDAVFESGPVWRLYLRPSGSPPQNEEICRSAIQESISFVDEESGEEVEKKAAIVAVGDVPDQEHLTYVGLPCFEVNKSFFFQASAH